MGMPACAWQSDRGQEVRTARIFALLGGLALWPWLGGAQAAGEGSLATAVEAAYLVKFGAFVQWPSNGFPGPDGDFNLCVAGDNPFGGLVDRAARGEDVSGHPIRIKHFRSVPDNSGCQLLFVADSARPSVEEALARVRGTPVLTITELPRSAQDKGIINFVIEQNHVRFEIDNGLAGESGLRISSQLLALAVAVRPQP
jgi:YfiR/HmsC-like